MHNNSSISLLLYRYIYLFIISLVKELTYCHTHICLLNHAKTKIVNMSSTIKQLFCHYIVLIRTNCTISSHSFVFRRMYQCCCPNVNKTRIQLGGTCVLCSVIYCLNRHATCIRSICTQLRCALSTHIRLAYMAFSVHSNALHTKNPSSNSIQ